MATETGSWVDPAINAVAGEVVSPVRHLLSFFQGLSDGGFEFKLSGVAVITVAGLMAKRTDGLVLVSLVLVRCHPGGRVVKITESQVVSPRIVTVGTGG